jgi:methyl-accepting chemotaxis protein
MSRRLVLRMTALVALVAIFLSTLTALAMRQILVSQLDSQLQATAARLVGQGAAQGHPPAGGGGPGQAQGLLYYVQGSGGFVQVEDIRGTLGSEVSEPLEALTASPDPTDVYLPRLGEYRVLTTQVGSSVIVTGLPMASITASMWAIIAAAAALTLLGILIAFVASRSVVERSLRPLARLATTATQVSALELGSGEVAVPVRVPDADADPRSEVGQVGIAFNHMLDNVEGALAARQRSETQVRQFVADASHELRNPLAAIRGYAELTRRERGEAPPTTAHALTRIEAESERMSKLVEDLLLLARLDSGPALAAAATPLNQIVADAVSDARAAGPRASLVAGDARAGGGRPGGSLPVASGDREPPRQRPHPHPSRDACGDGAVGQRRAERPSRCATTGRASRRRSPTGSSSASPAADVSRARQRSGVAVDRPGPGDRGRCGGGARRNGRDAVGARRHLLHRARPPGPRPVTGLRAGGPRRTSSPLVGGHPIRGGASGCERRHATLWP